MLARSCVKQVTMHMINPTKYVSLIWSEIGASGYKSEVLVGCCTKGIWDVFDICSLDFITVDRTKVKSGV